MTFCTYRHLEWGRRSQHIVFSERKSYLDHKISIWWANVDAFCVWSRNSELRLWLSLEILMFIYAAGLLLLRICSMQLARKALILAWKTTGSSSRVDFNGNLFKTAPFKQRWANKFSSCSPHEDSADFRTPLPHSPHAVLIFRSSNLSC